MTSYFSPALGSPCQLNFPAFRWHTISPSPRCTLALDKKGVDHRMLLDDQLFQSKITFHRDFEAQPQSDEKLIQRSPHASEAGDRALRHCPVFLRCPACGPMGQSSESENEVHHQELRQPAKESAKRWIIMNQASGP